MPPAIAVPFQVLPRLPLVVAFTALLVVRPATGASQAIPTERGSVADWGGEGPLLSFLPGFGTGAHIFDGLAPAFTHHFHVIALTPRGFPPSSAPDSGYTIAQLAADVLGVVDSSQARQAVLAGHSISGAVITRFAEAYPDRLLAAVYLDAAFDFGAAYRRSRLRPRLDVSSIDTTAARYRGWKTRPTQPIGKPWFCRSPTRSAPTRMSFGRCRCRRWRSAPSVVCGGLTAG